MELSPTWFLRTLSSKMWIFTILSYFTVFFGFFFTLFLYRKGRKLSNKQHSTLGEVFMYMWTFIASQGIESRWTKKAFWKVQVLNFSYLHIIVATGFSTFLVTLLSTKYYEMPFHELDDFSRIRSHNICIWSLTAPVTYFGTLSANGVMKPFKKWEGIVNQAVCDPFFTNSFEKETVEDFICSTKGKIAFVMGSIDVDDE